MNGIKLKRLNLSISLFEGVQRILQVFSEVATRCDARGVWQVAGLFGGFPIRFQFSTAFQNRLRQAEAVRAWHRGIGPLRRSLLQVRRVRSWIAFSHVDSFPEEFRAWRI